MDINPRSDAEILAIAAALARTGGEAPAWLQNELQDKIGLPPIPLDPDAYRWHMKAALTAGAFLLGFIACADLVPDVGAQPNLVARSTYVVDEDGRDAVAIVQQSMMAGDDENVLARLGGIRRHADGAAKAWSAEREDGGSYLVIYRAPAGAPAYAFEVNLETEEVSPTPEAVDALALLRVRAVEEQERLIAEEHARTAVAAN